MLIGSLQGSVSPVDQLWVYVHHEKHEDRSCRASLRPKGARDIHTTCCTVSVDPIPKVIYKITTAYVSRAVTFLLKKHRRN